MASVGIYADDEYLAGIESKAYELRITKSQLTRIAFDNLLGLTSPKKFGLDRLLIELNDDQSGSCQTKNPSKSA